MTAKWEPQTEAGRRLLWMFATKEYPNGTRHPRSFDARLSERIVQEFVGRIEAEAIEMATGEVVVRAVR